MNAELILFILFAALTLVSGAMVITARNPVNSAMALVATFFFLAGVYVLLWAHTIAALQVLVYTGAIMVLFLFVIMLLNLTSTDLGARRVTLGRVLGGAATLALLGVLALALSRLGSDVPPMLGAEQVASFGTVRTLGLQIFTQWLLPFEAVSLLLLVAMVGAVVVAKSRI